MKTSFVNVTKFLTIWKKHFRSGAIIKKEFGRKNTEVYLESYQAAMIELFAKIV